MYNDVILQFFIKNLKIVAYFFDVLKKISIFAAKSQNSRYYGTIY